MEKDGIPFRIFSNVPVGESDDFEANILPRAKLNELYQLLDVCVISSRWEGGPHSLLEALLAGRPVISTPVGISRDLLPDSCLFRTPAEAAALLADHAGTGSLTAPAQASREKALVENNSATLRAQLLAAYEKLPTGGVPWSAAARSAFGALQGRFGSREDFPSHPRAALTERLMQDLKTRPPADDRLIETPLDAAVPQAQNDLLAAAVMCRDANIHS